MDMRVFVCTSHQQHTTKVDEELLVYYGLHSQSMQLVQKQQQR
jgi:hypothetical protein